MARSVADEIMTVMASRAFVFCVVNGVILYLALFVNSLIWSLGRRHGQTDDANVAFTCCQLVNSKVFFITVCARDMHSPRPNLRCRQYPR